jgi:hypothetical protein
VAGVESVRLPDTRLSVDGRRVSCTTRLAYGGAYQLTIWTVVPELATELHSSYLGHPDGDTAVSHLHLRPGQTPLSRSEQSTPAAPCRYAKRGAYACTTTSPHSASF